MSSIVLKKMNAQIGDFALKNINIEVPKGVIVGLIGKNGAGKSTLLKAINGTHLMRSGEIRINGMSYLDNEFEIRKQLELVHDVQNFHQDIKVKKIERIYGRTYPNFDKDLFCMYMDKFEIPRNKKIGSLSLGQRKKLMMIIAICVRPSILLLDEPLIGIDPIDKQEFIRIIQTFMEVEDNSVIISSHQVEDIQKIADYIAFVNDGELILFEEKDKLISDYRFTTLSKDDENIKVLINPVENSLGLSGIVKSENVVDSKMNSSIASLEQIFVHTCSQEESR